MSDFELKIIETESDSGAILVSWCFNKVNSDIDYTNAYIVLVTYPIIDQEKYHDRKRECITLCKITNKMEYVQFERPGLNRIAAFIINDGFINRGRLYLYSFINYNYSPNDSYISCYIDVDVPKEFFAPEPFDKKWVDLVLTTPVNNQCQFRRRRLFAYTIQPFAIVFAVCLVIFLYLLITLFNLLRGKWTVWGFSDLFEIKSTKDFLTVPKFGNLKYIFLAIPSLLLLSCILYKIYLIFLLTIPLYIAIVTAAYYLYQTVILYLFDKFIKLLRYTFDDKRYQLSKKINNDKIIKELSSMCNKNEDELQKEKPIRLVFKKTGLKLCKPFAKS